MKVNDKILFPFTSIILYYEVLLPRYLMKYEMNITKKN